MKFYIAVKTLSLLTVAAASLLAAVPQMPYSYLAQPMNNSQTNVFLEDPGVIGASYLTVDQATGNPFGTNGTILYVDQEAMRVQSLVNGIAYVERGVSGTRVTKHGALSKVWAATFRYYWPFNPVPPCNQYSVTVTPAVVVASGSVFECVGAPNGIWVQIPVESGTWAVAILPWSKAQFSWQNSGGVH